MTEARDGRVITFYSYKGGTGRSMALANVAWILASNGKRVLTIDWDLEAPGLHRYFHPFLIDKDLTATDGVIDFVYKYSLAALTPAKGEGDGETWFAPYADLTRYAVSLDWPFRGADGREGTLDFIPAGRQGEPYSTRVNSFNWQNFYERLDGGAFLDAVRERLRAEYDYVLIDSRTGVSDTSGICTVHLPDTLVVCFTLNNQSIDGAAAVANLVRERRGAAAPRILPVPMRVEDAEKKKREAREKRARDKFKGFPALAHLGSKTPDVYWGEMPVLYSTYYAYEEILAAFGDRPNQKDSLLSSAEVLTAYLTEGSVKRLVPPTEAQRTAVLAVYEGTADEIKVKDAADEEPAYVNWREFISFSAKSWHAGGRKGYLLPKDQLAEAKRWMREKSPDLSVVERAYIQKSIDEAGKLPWWANLLIGFAMFAIFIGLVNYAVKRNASIDALAGKLLNDARAQTNLGDPELGALLAVESVRIKNTDGTDVAAKVLKQALAALPGHTAELSGYNLPMLAARLSADGKRAVTLAQDGATFVWETETGHLLAVMLDKPGPFFTSVAISADGTLVATGGADGSVCVWDAATGDLLAAVTAHRPHVHAVAFSPKGTKLVSAGDDGVVRYWSLEAVRSAVRLELLSELKPTDRGATPVKYLRSALFSPDGQYILVAGYYSDGPRAEPRQSVFSIWDAGTGNIVYTGSIFGRFILSAEMSPDNSLAVLMTTPLQYGDTGERDGTRDVRAAIFHWEAARRGDDPFYQETLAKAAQPVVRAGFTPDGGYVYTAGRDGSAWLSKVAPLKTSLSERDVPWEASRFVAGPVSGGGAQQGGTPPRVLNDMAFSADGNWVVLAREDGTVLVREVSPKLGDQPSLENLINLACSRVKRNMTDAEWKSYVSDHLPYFASAERKTCPNLP